MASERSGGWLTSAAAWLESEGAAWLHAALPYAFGVAGMLGGIFIPGMYAEFNATPGIESIYVWTKSWVFWGVVLSTLLGIWGARRSYREASQWRQDRERLGDKISEQAVSIADLKHERDAAVDGCRSQVEDAETHGEYLRGHLDSALKDLSASYLRLLVRDLNFGDTERISLYAHDGESSFILAGRYSLHPEHKKPSRQRIPDSQGIVANAWANGGKSFVMVKDYETPQEYLQNVREHCTIDDAAAGRLRMKSRVYYAKAINVKYTRTGVVLLESTRVDFLQEDNLDAIIKDNDELLGDLIHRSSVANPFMTLQRQVHP